MSVKFEKIDLDNLVDSSHQKDSILSKEEQLSLIKSVSVNVDVKIGEASLSIGELFDLKSGSVLTLLSKTTDPIELLLNGKVIAVGDLVVVDDNFGIQIKKISK